MRHLILCPELPPAPMPPGGIGTYVAHVSRLLAGAGDIVHLIGPRWSGAPRAVEEQQGGRLVIHRVSLDVPVPVPRNAADFWTAQREVAGLAGLDYQPLRFAWQAGLLAEKLVEDEAIDVIEAQEYAAPLCVFQLRRALGFGPSHRPPCIVHLHSPSEFIVRHNHWDLGDPSFGIAQRYEAYTIGAADALLCPSRYLARQAEAHFGLEPRSIELIPLPCGQTPLLPRDDAVWRSGSITYVGRLEPRKGVIEWVDAAVSVARDHPHTRFDLIGADVPYSDDVSVREYVEARIPRRMRSRFRFLGSLPRPQLLSRLAQARIVAVPSRWENFPNTCVEAMCVGLPVLASPNGGMVEMIEDGRTGWLASSSDAAALEEALRRALATPWTRLAEMGRAASESIRELCDNSAVVERHVEFRQRVSARGATASLRLPANLPWLRRPLRERERLAVPRSDGSGIAVIVACADRGFLLRDALKCLRRQARAAVAIVVAAPEQVDKETRLALERARNQGVRVFCSQRTAAEAKNAAIDLILAQQKRPVGFAFVDVGDRLHPSFLESCEVALRSCAEAGLVSSWKSIRGEEDGFVAEPCPSFPYQLLRDGAGPTIVVRTEVLEQIEGFRPSLEPRCDTWDLANAVMAAGWAGVTLPGLLYEHWNLSPRDATPSAVPARMTNALLSRIPQIVSRNASKLAMILRACLRSGERQGRAPGPAAPAALSAPRRARPPIGSAVVGEGPLISVVICTHQRAAHLRRALQSVLDQSSLRVDFEVIVVDNGSTDDTAEVVRSFRDRGDVRYEHVGTLGLCQARNRGWRAACGRYVAYLGDDAMAQPGWLEAIAAAFDAHPVCGMLAGRVEPIWEAERPSWLSDTTARSLAIVDWNEAARPITDLNAEWLVGANLILPRDVLAEVGGFHPALERTGSRPHSGAEALLQKAVARRGYQCVYDRAVAVRHLVPASRLEKRWLIRRYYSEGVSEAAVRLIGELPSWRRRLRWGLRDLARLLLKPRELARILRRPDDPERFEASCHKWLEVGRTLGFLGAARPSRPRIRVRLLRTDYPHWGEHTGINQFIGHLDNCRYALDVRLVSDSDEDFPIRNKALRSHARRFVDRRGMRYYKLSDLTAELRALAPCLLGRVDVLHYLDGERTAQLLPLLGERWHRSRVKLLATFHQPPEILAEILDREVVSLLDHVIAISPSQEEYFLDFLPKDKVTTILHGVDADFFTPPWQRRGGQRLRCITAGHRLRDWDAIRSVALALASDRDVEFHVVTNRETGLEDLDNVTFHRDVAHEELLALYQGADALLLPLTKATATNTLLQGMACGLPVVSSRTLAVEAYLPRDAGILVKKNSPDELVEALLALKRAPDRRTAAGQCARARAEALDWPIVARGYSEIYAMLASRL